MTIMVTTSGAGFRCRLALLLLAVSLLAFGGAGSATAQPARSPADQARAFLEDHFAAEQQPPRRRARPFEGWMTSRFAGLWNRAKARGQREETPFPEADPILNAQDSERPGDIRIEEVAGTPDRPTVRVSFRVFAGDATRRPRSSSSPRTATNGASSTCSPRRTGSRRRASGSRWSASSRRAARAEAPAAG